MAMRYLAASLTFVSLAAAGAEIEWRHHHGELSGGRYAAIAEIDRGNVGDLRVAWTFSLGVPGGLQGTPIVQDGFMYVTTGWGDVFKLDLREQGKMVWHFDPKVDREVGARTCCGINNRGVAVDGKHVYTNALDGRIFALDKASGEVLWETAIARPSKGETITNAPLVVNGMVYTGVSGGEYGIRGWVAALDAKTGALVWRKHTTPAPGEPGHETWEAEGTWKTGGGATWITGVFDARADTLYWGVGNPGPDWDYEYRPGDNLYTNSMLALDPATGRIKWYFQFTPADAWDYDGNNEPLLVDTEIQGVEYEALLHADRNGFFYALDRTNGDFIYGIPFVDELTWTRGLDPETGRPLDRNPDTVPSRDHKRALTCPGNMGGKNWPPMSYSPREKRVFVPVIESCNVLTNEVQEYREGEFFTGGGIDMTEREIAGSLTAIDVASGKVAWKTKTASPLLGGVLATAGGLVFTGHPDGRLVAYDSGDGKPLWSFSTGTAINAPPISYTVDGRQQVAVLAGTGGSWPLWFMASTPWLAQIRPGSMLYVFELPPA